MIRHLSYTIAVSLFLAFPVTSVIAQQEEGITQYKAGNFKEASVLFKKALKIDPQNGSLWNYYALSQQQRRKLKDAEKAYKKAIALEPNNSVYHSNLSFLYLSKKDWDDAEGAASTAIELNTENSNAYYTRSYARFHRRKFDEALKDCDQALMYTPGLVPLYILKSEILMRRFGQPGSLNYSEERFLALKDSYETLSYCLNVCDGDTTEVKERLENQRAFYTYYEERRRDSEAPRETVRQCEPLKILSKPRPSYTETARRNSVTGTIRIMVVFMSDGKIGQLLLLQGLPAGLNGEAINVARGIKFKPESCDGVPRTAVKTISYSFTIY